MHWMYPYGGGWFMMGFWWLAILVVIVLAVGWLSRRNRASTTGDPAMEILRRRYAHGEISKEEFEEKKRDLV